MSDGHSEMQEINEREKKSNNEKENHENQRYY